MERDFLIRSLLAFALDASGHEGSGADAPTTLRVRHRSAESLLPLVRARLAAGGHATVAGRCLSVQTTAENLDDIRALLARVDLPPAAQ